MAIPEAILHAPREADDVQQSLGSMAFCGDGDDFEDEDQVISKTHLHTPCTLLALVLWCTFERTIHIFVVVMYVMARHF